MDIIGRKSEIKRLKELLDSDSARFMAVYGRRRVGKTYLIKAFFSSNNCSFLHTTGIKDVSSERQIEEFMKQLETVFFEGLDIETPKDWFGVFELLTKGINDTRKNRKVVLFLDEFPWMATAKSGLLEALEYYWNRYWSSDPRLKLIVCGSSASWIIRKIIKNTGGLYKRVTDRIKLEPFTLAETRKFLESKKIKLNIHQILKIYMVTGGVPLYLDKVEKGLSADQVIDMLCFDKDGFLFDELKELFEAIFDDSDFYIDLIKAILGKRYGISKTELIKKLRLKDGGTLTNKLQELEDCGFIISFIPYGRSLRGQYYKVVDEYTAFYFKWIEPKKNAIMKLRDQEGYWLEQSLSPGYQAWSGLAFEAICFKHIQEIRKNLNLSANSLPYGWRYSPRNSKDDGAQIDLLFDRSDDSLTVCEIKYSNEPYSITKKYSEDLKKKLEIFRKRSKSSKQIFLAMILANGLKPNLYSDELVSSVVTLEDLFEELL